MLEYPVNKFVAVFIQMIRRKIEQKREMLHENPKEWVTYQMNECIKNGLEMGKIPGRYMENYC